MKGSILVILLASLLGSGILLPSWESKGTDQSTYLLPGNIKAGWKVLNQKKCLR